MEDLRSVRLADSGRLDLVLTEIDFAAEFESIAPTLRSILEPAGFSLMLELMQGTIRADAAATSADQGSRSPSRQTCNSCGTALDSALGHLWPLLTWRPAAPHVRFTLQHAGTCQFGLRRRQSCAPTGLRWENGRIIRSGGLTLRAWLFAASALWGGDGCE
ncbi:hypothetical protein GGQ88_000794 [Novosphingobium hassiacum]|uniref:Uncharacterized protein n=1 Tax=Novosphingobium hassiacum TaxID=173676 RepID=A0A7W5ZUN8_9SPHN|nr:hypothetical protein [Novosphingobium hassiacum]MBB3859554.1 hypothetical protein [Novosphingobium hassiacum]